MMMKSGSDSINGGIGETPELGASSAAAIGLLAANVGLLLLYIALDLTLFQLVFIYWSEALWIGLFSGLKLVFASMFGSPYENRWVEISRGSSLLLSVFAVFKTGGAYLVLMMLTGVALVVAQQELTGTAGSDFIREQAGLVLKCSLLFLLGHGLSFIVNFLLLGEFKRARFGTLLWLPFKRSFALFVAVAASLTAIQAFPGLLTSATYAALLILIKLTWDFFLHRRERLSFSVSGLRAVENK